MKFGHFLVHYPAPGGTSTSVRELTGALAKLGHPQVTISTQPTAPDAIREHRRIIETGLLDLLRTTLPHPIRRQLSHEIRNAIQDLDVLVVHGMFTPTCAAMSRLALDVGVPVITTARDPYDKVRFARRATLKRTYWRMVESPHIRRSSAIHVLAPSHKNVLRARGIKNWSFATPNGIQSAWASLLATPAFPATPPHSKSEPFQVLYLGRWDVHKKGLDFLLQAFRLQPQAPAMRLRICGRSTPNERKQVGGLVRDLRLESQVELMGFVADPREIIRNCSVLVLPSRSEGFGNVVLEALALGRPVIVSKRAGVAEWLPEDVGAIHCEPTASDVGQAILRTIEGYPELLAQATIAREHILRRFSWGSIAELWEDAASRITEGAI